MIDVCCIGHITLDKVITPGSVVDMPGGTSFYFSNAQANLDISFVLVTAIADEEKHIAAELRNKGIEVQVIKSTHTVCFENRYEENQDNRTQRVTQKADPFSVSHVEGIDARIFHLGPLLAGDIPLDVIKFLSGKGIVSLDVQGYLREVRDQNVFAVDWQDKEAALNGLDILKANESEMEVLTGYNDPHKAARSLAAMGVKEVIITLGSQGSLIYADEVFYDIPAYQPSRIVDATGCGDTYMAGYLYQKAKGTGLQAAGNFAAAMATLKIENSGPFSGTAEDVYKRINMELP